MPLLLSGLLKMLRDSMTYRDLRERITNGESTSHVNVVRSARPYMLATLASDWDGPILYLTAQVRRAYNISEQLPVWQNDDDRLHRFAEPSALFYDRAPWDASVIRNRIETLSVLMEENPDNHPIIVSSARAMMQRTMPPRQFRQSTLNLNIGDRHNLDKLVRAWVGMGYEPSTMVIEPGTFSRRGGILDIYPLAAEYPMRIEFFDDEIESLRQFDPASQRSINRVKSLRIVPAREVLPELTPMVGQQLQAWAESLKDDEADFSSIASDIESLTLGNSFGYLEYYLPYVYPHPVSLLDYAPDNTLILIEDPDELQETIVELADKAEANRADAQSSYQIMKDHPTPYVDWETLQQEINSRQSITLSNISVETQNGNTPRLFKPGERYGAQLRMMLNQIREYRNQGDRVVIITEQVTRLKDLWHEQDSSSFIPTIQEVTESLKPASLTFIKGTLAEGWSLQGAGGNLHMITDAEIFGWTRAEPRRRRETSGKRTSKTPETAYMDWTEGTHVVHVDYGIGQFMGLRHRTVNGNEREYLLIEYHGTDTLFVPIHQADRLTRYVGADEVPPKLNKLGKSDLWVKARKKAQHNAEEEAKELLGIYSKRARAQGFTYNPDSAWQHEMEANFPFVETEDQIRVIQDVKADMESTMPMDRLVCGDVGFGKTEVALRAAFKAIQDGKQVAVIVPTTILAQQHYQNFSSRLEPFPVVVEMLSRFRTKAQQGDIARRLENGEVDIVVGTHRLFSSDIDIKNLGLIIIDEEQRFGVKHKEHFKKLRATIDILTLTATPIPRTLFMSLSGIRDISMIQTPPEERLPVVTQVGSWDEKLVRLAIMRELERGGQAFVVHNRVKTIQALKARLERIVPEARTIIAHGQMSPRTLENVMTAFSRGEYDILISTSIIENGIDMPRVNTLVVDRADWFGMSQLYQLRGRVGRSAQQAYAYFFHTPGTLTEEAHARLETLSENTQLGAGFQIAIRDLELRGGGDVLSMRQSGHVASVGLHLYTEMLQQAIKEQKGELVTDTSAPASARERIIIDLPLPAYIPTDWIPEMALRLQIYRRIGNIQNPDDIESIKQELLDRFGSLPAAVEGLLYLIEIKLLAQAINATHVIMPRGHILVKLPYLARVDRQALALELGDDIEVTRTDIQLLAEEDIWQWRLMDILNQLKESFQLEAT
jgi:transcription-repair coupling factor (superfamily II helicase)